MLGLSPVAKSGSITVLTKLSSLQSGTLGELLTVAKLNTLGHAAYIIRICLQQYRRQQHRRQPQRSINYFLRSHHVSEP